MREVADDSLTYFDLIPHNPMSLMHEPRLKYMHLRLFEFMIEHASSALETLYLDQDYHEFDPHVGDTLCQIRASQLLYFAKNPSVKVKTYISYLQGHLEKARIHASKIQEIIKIRRPKKIMSEENHQTLEEFLKGAELHLSLTKQIDYLTKAFLLTKYKIHALGSTPRINYAKLQRDAGISKDLSDRLIRHWQRGIAYYSTTHMGQIANEEDQPYFIVQGISTQLVNFQLNLRNKLRQEIIKKGIKKILLASVANHPQYSGKKLAALSENIYHQAFEEMADQKELSNLLSHVLEAYLQAKDFAKTEGCNYQNPYFIFVEHMYIGLPREQLKKFNLKDCSIYREQ